MYSVHVCNGINNTCLLLLLMIYKCLLNEEGMACRHIPVSEPNSVKIVYIHFSEHPKDDKGTL